jgi:hypothetical protein
MRVTHVDLPTCVSGDSPLEKIFRASFIDDRRKTMEIESGQKFYSVSGDLVMDFDEQRILRSFGTASGIWILDPVEVFGSPSLLEL